MLRHVVTFFLILNLSYSYAAEPNAFQTTVVNAALHTAGISPKPLVTLEGASARMLVFTAYNGYKTSDTQLGATIWATAEPEIKKICHAYLVKKQSHATQDSVEVQIAKLLGLPAEGAEKRRFIVLDVPLIQAYYGSSPKNIGLFRPCTDPRIGPHRDGTDICPKQMNAADPSIGSDFKTWFINNSIRAYAPTGGAPWTEYGYTYDWNDNANGVYGVSEFVILKNTPVTVLANPVDSSTPYVSAEDYCK